MAFYRNERTKIAKTWGEAKAMMISELQLWDNSYENLTKDIEEYKGLYKECKKKRNEFEDELDRVKVKFSFSLYLKFYSFRKNLKKPRDQPEDQHLENVVRRRKSTH